MELYQAVSLKRIRCKLAALFILNAADAYLSSYLLKTGKFMEVNFLLKEILPVRGTLSIVKCVLPAVLLSLTGVRMQKATRKQLIGSNRLINAILLLYVVIDGFHLIWLSILPHL